MTFRYVFYSNLRMNGVQDIQPSQIAQLRRDCPIQLIVVEASKIDEGSGSRTRRHSNNNGPIIMFGHIFYSNMRMNGVQVNQSSHLAQFRRDWSIQLIVVEEPKIDEGSGSRTRRHPNNNGPIIMFEHVFYSNMRMNGVQVTKTSQIAQLRRDWSIQLIAVEVPKIDEG